MPYDNRCERSECDDQGRCSFDRSDRRKWLSLTHFYEDLAMLLLFWLMVPFRAPACILSKLRFPLCQGAICFSSPGCSLENNYYGNGPCTDLVYTLALKYT